MCAHASMEVVHGDCRLCYGGIEYCSECGAERQLHEAHCPEDPDCPKPLAIRHWKQIPYALRNPGGPRAEEVFGVRFVELRRGESAVYAAESGVTLDGERWIEDPYQYRYGGM